MGGREVGGQKWAAGEVGEWRGEEGVGITYEGAMSRMRARAWHHGRGCSITDEGAASQMRAQRPGGGHGITHEGAVRGVSAARMRAQRGGRWQHGCRMRRAARTAGCMATHALLERMYQVDVAGTMVVLGLAGRLFHVVYLFQARYRH